MSQDAGAYHRHIYPTNGTARWFSTRAAVAVLRRPRLWGVAAGAALTARRRGWWRRPPFLPLPDAGYLAWREHTAYGDGVRSEPEAVADLLAYLEWRGQVSRGVAREMRTRSVLRGPK